ncbi:MAG: hypothetical protein WAT79_12345 [Saprospiraceae bacterium]
MKKNEYIYFSIFYGLTLWLLTGGGGLKIQVDPAYSLGNKVLNLISYILGVGLSSLLFLYLLPYFIFFVINKYSNKNNDQDNKKNEDKLFKIIYFIFLIWYTILQILSIT